MGDSPSTQTASDDDDDDYYYYFVSNSPRNGPFRLRPWNVCGSK